MNTSTEKTMEGLVDAVTDGFSESNFRMIQCRSILFELKQDLQATLVKMKDDVRIIKKVIHILLTEQGLYKLLTIEEKERLKDQEDAITTFITQDDTADVDTVTTVWKSPFDFPNEKEDHEENVVGSRVLDLEAITDDDTDLSNVVSPPKIKRQKLMHDYFDNK